MPINYSQLLGLKRELSQQYTTKDTILYALGVGAGIGADSAEQLRYVYEENLQALPTMSVVLAAPGFWQREPTFGINWEKILHGEQSVEMHEPLPAAATVTSVLTVDGIYDKGAGKGALLYSTRRLYNQANGTLLATVHQGSFLRGDGGGGSTGADAPKPHTMPENKPADFSVKLETRPEQALLYRLCGDFNPLHADPAVATRAGFKQPILHGLATYGIVGRALIGALCTTPGYRLRRLDVRFSSPVYPGESIITEIWRDGPGRASFRALVAERNVVVLNNGYAEYA